MKQVEIIFVLIVLVILSGCGGVSANDKAVCEAYQALVDVWPADSADVEAADSPDEVWEAVTSAGLVLIAASEAAETAELGAAGKLTGEAAASFTDRNKSLVERGFIPFFNEEIIAGSGLSQLCEQIGTPVTLP